MNELGASGDYLKTFRDVSKHAAKMLKQLGIKPISFKYQEVGSSVNIILETGR